jgi:hypothetical protein
VAIRDESLGLVREHAGLMVRKLSEGERLTPLHSARIGNYRLVWRNRQSSQRVLDSSLYLVKIGSQILMNELLCHERALR